MRKRIDNRNKTAQKHNKKSNKKPDINRAFICCKACYFLIRFTTFAPEADLVATGFAGAASGSDVAGAT